MAFLPQFTVLGQLELIEIYGFYDQPVLFSCRNAAGNIFLAIWVDENDAFDTWLYAGMSQRRFEHIRSGAIDLHEAFSRVEDGTVFEVRCPYDATEQISVALLASNSIKEAHLPAPGEFLNLETKTLPDLDSDIVRRAIQSNREWVSLDLSLYRPLRTEIPAKVLGDVLRYFQGTVDALGEAIAGQVSPTGPIPTDITSKTELAVLRVGPGSFTIELASLSMVDSFGASEIGDALAELMRLLKMSGDQAQLRQLLGRLSPRVASWYLSLLRSIGNHVADARLEWASPVTNRSDSASISALTAIAAAGFIEQWEEQSVETYQIHGVLIGANLRTRRFEIETPEKRYSGKTLEDAWDTLSQATLSQQYIATIRETQTIKPATGVGKSDYFLVDLQPYELAGDQDQSADSPPT